MRFFVILAIATLSVAAAVGRAEAASAELIAELKKLYPEVPEEQNAASLFLKGFNAITNAGAATDIVSVERWPLTNQLPPSSMTALASCFKSNEVAFSYMERASLLTNSRYGIDVARVDLVPFPYAGGLLNANVLLVTKALWQASAADAPGAAKSLRTSFTIAKSLESEPLLAAQIVRQRSLGLSMDGLQQVLNRVQLSQSSMIELSRSLVEQETRDSVGTNWLRALQVQRLFVGQFMSRLVEEKTNALLLSLDEDEKELVQNPDVQEKDKQFLIAFIDEVQSMWRSPEKLPKLQNYCRQRTAIAVQQKLVVSKAFLSWVSEHAAIEEATSLAELRIALTALALEQDRADHHNTYADSLNALVPRYMAKVPLDPFTGKPLQYRRVAKGYSLSVSMPLFKANGTLHKLETNVFSVINPSLRK